MNLSGRILRDDKLECAITIENNLALLKLSDRSTGASWGPVPLLALDVHDHAERCPRRVPNCEVTRVENRGDNLVAFTFADKSYGIGLAVEVGVFSGELVARFHPDSLVEKWPNRYRLFVADLLPDLMKAGPGGRMLLPVSAGVSCSPANKPAVSDAFLIYLEQPRWKLETTFPFAGVEEGGTGLAAIATAGAADTQCRVTTDGGGRGWTNLAFSLRQHWPDPVDAVPREIRFFPLPRGKAGHWSIAKRLRRHAIEDLGKKTLLERAAEHPPFAYQLDSIVLVLFHGMRNYGAAMRNPPETPGEYIDTMTFREAGDILASLKAAGIPKIYTRTVGWNIGGHDGAYPTRFPVNPEAGGEEEFRALLARGAELGYELGIHDNFQMNIPGTPDYLPECVIQDMFGEPLMRGWWAGGEEYATWYQALPESRRGAVPRKLRELGARGMYYCDYMMPPLEVNHHPLHRGGRSAHLQGILEFFDEIRSLYGSVGVEYPTFASYVACDSCQHGGVPAAFHSFPSHWPINPLLEDATPLPMIPLAISGLTLTQANDGPCWSNILRSIAYGQRPRDAFGVRPIDMPTIHVFEPWRIPALKHMHDLCIERFGHLMTREIVSCEYSEPEAIVTEFDDGTKVEADLQALRLVVNGSEVPRPEGLPD